MSDQRYELHPVGRVESLLVDLAAAPKQGKERDLKPVLDRAVER